MSIIHFLLLLSLIIIVILDIIIVTYLVSSTQRKKWLFYFVISLVYLFIFLFFKYYKTDVINVLFYWKQPFMVLTYHSVLIMSLMAILIVPKHTIEKIIQNKFYILGILFIFLVLFIIY